MAIGVIWPLSLLLGLPTPIYNVVRPPSEKVSIDLCIMLIPTYVPFKVTECILFFLGPVLIQIVMYVIVGRRLFVGTERLHRKQTILEGNGMYREKDADAIKARRGVVKMLIASVIVYFLSYAPAQVPLFYNLLSPTPFRQNWPFLVLVMTLGYINSAANPILYSIFSQNFRRKFRHTLCCQQEKERYRYQRTASNVGTGRSVRFSVNPSNTATSAITLGNM